MAFGSPRHVSTCNYAVNITLELRDWPGRRVHECTHAFTPAVHRLHDMSLLQRDHLVCMDGCNWRVLGKNICAPRGFENTGDVLRFRLDGSHADHSHPLLLVAGT